VSSLQPASALDIRVAVHQRHRKLFGLDVDADCAAALKPPEGQFATTQIVRRGGVGQLAPVDVELLVERTLASSGASSPRRKIFRGRSQKIGSMWMLSITHKVRTRER
jgi:hypothetical protein